MQVGWTWSASRRGSLDIIWSCLFTVFICCWRVVHPNIPPPNSQWWHRFLDRTICLLLAALAPELVLAVAIREYLDAKACAKRLRLGFGDGSKDWSIVHGFYICMGGFHVRYRKGHNAEVTDGWLSAVDVEDHVKRGMLKLEEVISQEEIMDKGKADWLIKCMLGFQIMWLCAQCVTRAIQHLPITPLEISALTYVPFTLIALWVWWDKPYNINIPTLIDGQSRFRGAPLLTAYLSKQDIPGFQPSPYRQFALARECLRITDSGAAQAPDPVLGASSSFLFFFVGGVHCAAWNFPFPTLTEQWTWRVSSVVVLAITPLGWFLSSLYWLLYRFLMESSGRRASDERVYRHTYWHGESLELEYSHRSALAWKAILMAGACVYALARLCLVVQVFASLRALPEGCYQTIE